MIWLIGSGGMLGRDLVIELRQRNLDYIATDIDVDITVAAQVREYLDKNRPIHWIINAAAYTDVDKAEKEPQKAFAVNGRAVKNIAEVVKDSNVNVIHFSTDYVFDGKSKVPYKETDMPAPISVYGKSKLEGEQHLKNVLKRYFIFRISWLYGLNGKNFVNTMLKLFKEKEHLTVVNDQIGVPTYTKHLAANIVSLVERDSGNYGLYHYQDYSATGISWFTFAQTIKRLAIENGLIKRDVALTPVPSDEYPTPASRPGYSLFDTGKVRNRLGFRITPWETALQEYMENI